MVKNLISETDQKIKENINTFKPIKSFNYTESLYVFKLIGASLKNAHFYTEIQNVMHFIE